MATFSKEDKILIKTLNEKLGHNARHLAVGDKISGQMLNEEYVPHEVEIIWYK